MEKQEMKNSRETHVTKPTLTLEMGGGGKMNIYVLRDVSEVWLAEHINFVGHGPAIITEETGGVSDGYSVKEYFPDGEKFWEWAGRLMQKGVNQNIERVEVVPVLVQAVTDARRFLDVSNIRPGVEREANAINLVLKLDRALKAAEDKKQS